MQKAIPLLLMIILTGCSTPQLQDDELRQSTISRSEQLLRGKIPNETRKQPIKKMRLEDYAKYRNANSAQRESRGIFVDNFVRGLGIDGF